jgi:23S rRNA (cytidine1920-2'-O)/16S rRNA (cytidine1409-2'-O)-methyltransferase
MTMPNNGERADNRRDATPGPDDRLRLDVLLVEKGLVESREQGRGLIMAGDVLVDDQPITKPGAKVRRGAAIRLKARPRFVSRGGEKLHAALDRFQIDPRGWVCADVGASTGGFTDCLLQGGAVRVYAIDVGYGQLAWPLRQDERVVVLERVNARYLEHLPEPVELVTIDVSFISLRHLLPVVWGWLKPSGQVVALVKPQFEAGKGQVGKGGVVRRPEVHRQVLLDTAAMASEQFAVAGLIPSPVKGPAGNIEFLMWLRHSSAAAHHEAAQVESQVDQAVAEAHAAGPGEPKATGAGMPSGA